jgi:hypothetical protein
MMIEIKEEDINLYWMVNKKKDNDGKNRIREQIIYDILNNNINEDWYKNNKWNTIRTGLLRSLIETESDNYKIELKGGRNYNYDFIIKYNENEIRKIEFKYNCSSIDKYPQFLSISSNNFIEDEGYASYFYDNYLNKIGLLINISIPSKSDYLKYIHSNNYNNLLIFKEFKEQEKNSKFKEEKKKIVSESISKYLNTKIKLNINEINKYFKEKEKNKYYLLYKNEKFNIDYIKDEELEVVEMKEIKNNNTLILTTKSCSYISMLLRWKNHLGVLYPAWQISLMRK